ncbi:MAG TPA: opioid growth factor receptor-related protein [Phycisphaerae bacterium]|nr:opioid growth factor receptor-related protein [Phycisphaerae bacterium]
MPSNPLLTFYTNTTPDHAGRYLRDIHAFSLDQLESTHDFIQWLFPLDTPSPVNPFAPTLDAQTIADFRAGPPLQTNLQKSLNLMLNFYGLTRSAAAITRAQNFPARAHNYLHPNNHNHLRLTRILRSTHLLGLEQESGALLTALLAIAHDHPAAITPPTLHFWQNASHVAPPR